MKKTGQGDKPVVDQVEKNSESLYRSKSRGQEPAKQRDSQLHNLIEDAVVTASNAKLKESNSSANRSITVTGKNVTLNRQPTKPVSRDYKDIGLNNSTISVRALNRSNSFDQNRTNQKWGGKLNLPETTSTPARNISLTKLSKPKAALKQPVPIVREQNDSNAELAS